MHHLITARKRSLRRLCFYRCLSVHRGGVRGCSGGVCMVAWGACMVALGGCMVAPGGCAWLLRGCVWLLWGGVHGCSRGGMRGCSRGGVHGCSGGMHGCSGGMCGCSRGGRVWLLPGGGGMRGFFHEIRSMSGRYASYWNAF